MTFGSEAVWVRVRGRVSFRVLFWVRVRFRVRVQVLHIQLG